MAKRWTHGPWLATAWTCTADTNIQIVRILRADQRYDYVVRWKDSLCLGRDGIWEYEPQPSSRDEAFYERCRFASFAEAERAVEKVLGKK